MLNGRTVSVDMLIEQLIQDYGFETVNRAEVIEWVWRSMAIIGTPYPYEDKSVELDIVDYKSSLPLNLYSIGMIREKTTGIPFREMTDMFNKFGNSAYEGLTEITADFDPAYPYVSAAENTVESYQTIIGPNASSEFYTYKTQGNFIYFGMDNGTAEMQYKAMPIDIVTGMPTLPDNAIYLRGVEGFVAEKLAMRLLMKDQISERKYDIIAKNYYFDVGAAQNICRMPDPSRMETLINRWKSTYLGPEHFDTGLMYLGSRE
jgi:hypothetical protein